MTWILEKFLELVWIFISPLMGFIANLLPQVNTVSLPFLSSIKLIMAVGYQFSFVIPFNHLFLALSVIIGIDITLFSIKFGRWIADLVSRVIKIVV